MPLGFGGHRLPDVVGTFPALGGPDPVGWCADRRRAGGGMVSRTFADQVMTATEAAHTLQVRLAPHLDQYHPLACIVVGGASETDPPGLVVMAKTKRYAR